MNPVTQLNYDDIILSALKEDISSEDISTNSVLRSYKKGTAELLCKQDGVVCGPHVFERTFKLLDGSCEIKLFFEDGDRVKKGEKVAEVTGDMRAILSGERTALNFLQRMSGISTYTAQTAELLKGSKTTLLDTRKTTPNLRIFEKYAVKVGGGSNHRFNLSDGVMLKDNHIAAAGGIKNAVKLACEYCSFVHKIEVECENLDMCREAVEAGADIIMLDNMSVAQMKEAVALIDGRAQTECSGNVTRENISEILQTGVDFISSGALTHSAPILDFSLKNLHGVEQ